MSTETVGTDPGFIARVREAAGGPKPRAEALRDAVRAAGPVIGWHESETVAEALRHRYDKVVGEKRWLVVSEWRDPVWLAAVRLDMRTALVLNADQNGWALVDEPVEYRYGAPENQSPFLPSEDDRGRTPLTPAQVFALPDTYRVQIKLVGHVQRLDI